jgi:CheY-like chemotaxis protein
MTPSKPLVLVVESHPLVRASMVEALAEADITAIDVGSADEAVAMLEARTDIGLVFTETELPGATDGLELARRIKERFPPVSLIVATARPAVETEGLPAGASVVPKPYHDDAIVQKIAEILAPDLAPAFSPPSDEAR